MPCPLAVVPLQMSPPAQHVHQPELSVLCQGSFSPPSFIPASYIFDEFAHYDHVSISVFGLESSFCGPLYELGIQLPPSPNLIAMDFTPSLELPPLESKDSFSNEIEEGFIDATTSYVDRDSSQESYIVEFSKEHNLDVSLEIPPCNRPSPPLLLLHTYIDRFLPSVPEISVISFQEEISFATLRKTQDDIFLRSMVEKWLESDAGVARFGDLSLAEERKEQLEQLPPPLDIIDPPFDKVVSI